MKPFSIPSLFSELTWHVSNTAAGAVQGFRECYMTGNEDATSRYAVTTLPDSLNTSMFCVFEFILLPKCVFFRHVRKICERRQLASLRLPGCLSARNNSAPTGRIFMKFYISEFLKKSAEKKSVFDFNLTRTTRASPEKMCFSEKLQR
jgi:hypothetical protein